MVSNPLSVRQEAPLSGFSVVERVLNNNIVEERFVATTKRSQMKKTDPIASFIDSKILSGTNQSTTSSRKTGRSLDFAAMRGRLLSTHEASKSSAMKTTQFRVPFFINCDIKNNRQSQQYETTNITMMTEEKEEVDAGQPPHLLAHL